MPLSTLAAHSANAIGSKSLMPRAKCSAKGVMPAPTMATFLMPPPPAPVVGQPQRSPEYDSRHTRFGFECITVIWNPGSDGDSTQGQATACADLDGPGLGTGHLH